jgi:hypothetical protein
MSKTSKFISLIVMLAVLSPALVRARELTYSSLVRNMAMEIASGSAPRDWYNNNATLCTWATDAYVSTNHSLKIDDASSTVLPYWYTKGMPIMPGSSYMLEWDWRYANIDASYPFSIQIRWWTGPVDGSGNVTGTLITQSQYFTGLGTISSFAHNIQLAAAPPNCQSADIMISASDANEGTGTLWTDNVILRPAINEVLNADVEYGTTAPTDWSGSANATWATDRKVSGGHSLKIDDSTIEGAEYWISKAIPVFDYPVVVSWYWAYENVAGGEGMFLQVRWYDGNINANNAATGNILRYDTFTTPMGTDTDFTFNTHTLTPPPGAKTADLAFWGWISGSGTLWIDDVSFTRLEPIGFSDTPTYIPAPKPPRRLIRINQAGISDLTVRRTMKCLEGLVAQTRPQIILSETGATPIYINELRDYWDIPFYQKNTDWQWYIHNFKDHLINGRYILCNDNDESLQVATTLSGIYGALVCPSTAVKTVLDAEGLTQFMDVRTGLTETQVLNTYSNELNNTVAIEEPVETKTSPHEYASFAKTFMFTESTTALRTSVFGTLLDDNTFLMGYKNANQNEDTAVQQSSAAKVAMPVSDGYPHSVTWASVVDKLGTNVLHQNTRVTDPPVDATKHYVAFANSGSDNLGMVYGWSNGSTDWASPNRGTYNNTWAGSCTLMDLGPVILSYYYRTASTGANKDYWVAGIGGLGYLYPAKWGDATVMAQMLARQMQRADMTEVQFIEDSSWSTLDPTHYTALTAQAQIRMLMMMNYTDMDYYAGAIRWGNGKPIFGARYQIKPGGASDETYAAVTSGLNSQPVNVYSGKGYSWVVSDSPVDTVAVIAGLSSNCKVVTIDEMVQVMAKAMDVSPWTFDNDEQGWSGEDNPDDSDGSVLFNASGGYIYAEGKDTIANTNWNVRYWKSVPIPAAAKTLSFKVRADTSAKQAHLRVRIKDAGGDYTTPQDWTLISSTSYATQTYDISSFRNQRVTIYLEVDGDGTATGRLRFDDITIALADIPPAPTAGNNGPTCAGSTLSLTASTITGATYAWTGPNGFTSSLQNPMISGATTAATGTYSVTATVDGLTGPAGITTATVNPLPTASVNSETICAGSSATLTATSDANSPIYLWSPNAETTASITVSPVSTTTYTVTVTDGVTGCANSGSGTVTVNPLPTVSVNSETVSPGGSATLTATTGASSPGYLWSPGAETTASITVSPTSTATYTVTVTDGTTSCANSGSGTVTVTAPLLASVTISNILGTTLTYGGGAGLRFVLLKSDSIATPLSGWDRLLTNNATPGTFTIPAVDAGSQVFYSIKSE